MNTNNTNNHDSSTPEPDLTPWLEGFRGHLNLIITAHQTGQAGKLKALPGAKFLSHCSTVAGLPGNTLAREIAVPLTAVLQQLSDAISCCERILRRHDESSLEVHELAARILHQIDVALGLILRNLDFVSRRAEVAEDTEFLGEVLDASIHAGPRIARLLRRCQQMDPQAEDEEEGGYIGAFAWDVYQRVAQLDRLADEFPDAIRVAARRMPAWPMLRYRHCDNHPRFQKLASRLELGSDCPADAGNHAQFQPDDPMVRYLLPWIDRLHAFRLDTAYLQDASPEQENGGISTCWRTGPEGWPDGDTVEILRAVRRLPRLTKATAGQWAAQAIVPLILATDACDYANCADPALQAIARQKGAKDADTFKSRLSASVTTTLLQLARPK